MSALTSIMGFLLICIGITFIATGFLEGLTRPEVMRGILEAIRQAGAQ